MGALSKFNSKRVKFIDKNALNIIKSFENAGFEAYIVGGCLRDLLLGNVPKDWDIATSALPTQVCEVLKGYHIIPTGLKYGTVSVKIESCAYEITTFRVDGRYFNARSPESVDFTRSIEEDIKRRDFSINALYYAPSAGIVDRVGGMADLETKRIACVGNPSERFSEDALRILRALRFSATLGFRIESHTQKAMKKHKNLLNQISKERIGAEIAKILNAKFFFKVFQRHYAIFAVIFPEINALKGGSYERFLRAVGRIERYKEINALKNFSISNEILFFALLGHFVIKSTGEKDCIEGISRRLCVENAKKKAREKYVKFPALRF